MFETTNQMKMAALKVYRFERSWVLGLSILGYFFFYAFANGGKKMPIPQAPTHHGRQGHIPVASD